MSVLETLLTANLVITGVLLIGGISYLFYENVAAKLAKRLEAAIEVYEEKMSAVFKTKGE